MSGADEKRLLATLRRIADALDEGNRRAGEADKRAAATSEAIEKGQAQLVAQQRRLLELTEERGRG